MAKQIDHLKVASYPNGSYIIVENQRSQDFFFIVKSGRVQVDTTVDILLGESTRVLTAGAFFGVFGAMGNCESNETAVAMEDCTLILVRRQDFGLLLDRAPKMALNIIHTFSRNLRLYDDELAKRFNHAPHSEEDFENLFCNGKFYFDAGQHGYAAKIFSNYIKHYPNGAHVGEVKPLLELITRNDPGIVKPEETGFHRLYEDGEMICSEYMIGSELYIIQSGKVKITKVVNNQEVLIAILNAGDIVGEMSLLDGKTRTANIIAHGPTRVLAVNKANFENIMFQNHEVATKLLTLLANRIWVIYRRLANALYRKPLTRLWDALFTELLKSRAPIGKKEPHQFSVDRAELIKMCGLDEQTGGKAFDVIANDRCIEINNEGIYCNDTGELQQIVESVQKSELRALKVKQVRDFQKFQMD